MSADLAASTFTASMGTLVSDYTLPTAASGAGAILAKSLTASIVGDPTKTYDGTTAATLTPANFQLIGLIGSDGFDGSHPGGGSFYDSKDTNARSGQRPFCRRAISPQSPATPARRLRTRWRRPPAARCTSSPRR